MDPHDRDAAAQEVTHSGEIVHVGRDQHEARLGLALRQQTELSPHPLLKLAIRRLVLGPCGNLLHARVLELIPKVLVDATGKNVVSRHDVQLGRLRRPAIVLDPSADC